MLEMGIQLLDFVLYEEIIFVFVEALFQVVKSKMCTAISTCCLVLKF